MPRKRIESRKAPFNLIDTQVIQAKGLKSRGVDDIRRLARQMIQPRAGGSVFARAQRLGMFLCMSPGLRNTRVEQRRFSHQSEERRVGKAGVSKGRSRCSPHR